MKHTKPAKRQAKRKRKGNPTVRLRVRMFRGAIERIVVGAIVDEIARIAIGRYYALAPAPGKESVGSRKTKRVTSGRKM